MHPEVGRVGSYGVFLGDERDAAAYIPLSEDQTNIREGHRAAFHALQGRRPGEQSPLCPDCLLIVKGVLVWAQRWGRHNGTHAKGPIQHCDLWEKILTFHETLGDHVKWLHTHLGTWASQVTRADHLANIERRRSPLLFGHISARPRQAETTEEEEQDEDPIAGWEE